MKKSTYVLLWTLALALLAAVLVFVNLPEKAPPSVVDPTENTPVPLGAAVGETLPDFTITCTDGSAFTLSAQRGKVVVINLWATWCTPCVRELPNFDRLLRERKVAVLAVHAPPVTTDVPAYLAAYGYAIPFAVDEDGSLSALLNASTVLPQTIVVSPEGVVTYNQEGALDYETLVSLVDAAAE
ncbi:MAG: TlpA family protein disulfide reductase [Oscillospiraceae bacterium]|nr:TlpA family protein disulfide reductase [Oscillospiraceae bacterium]